MTHQYAFIRNILSLLLPLILPHVAQAQISPGSNIHGFTVEAIYLDDALHRVGGRFVHQATGFQLDHIVIQSAPQTFLWVNSVPTSDMGEPHTQEHLLLGKGNVGLWRANLEEMLLVRSSAYTEQIRTVYHLQTVAGAEAWYRILGANLYALLYPDYSDDEIRREVRNFGVLKLADESLSLEEKGTVYNEMVSSFGHPWRRMMRPLDILMYGDTHPMAFVSGGLPEAIRKMQADDIRKFHRNNYYLANMGMIASLPESMPIDDVLQQVGTILDSVSHGTVRSAPRNGEDIPVPHPVSPGAIRLSGYPSASATDPGIILLGWAPTLRLDPFDEMLIDLFIANLAGDAGTPLYKRFIDAQTRTVATGASSVFGWVSTGSGTGNPVYIGLDNVDADRTDSASVVEVRTAILAEISRIANLADGSNELNEFNRQIMGRLIEQRRAMSRFIYTPPGFGYRGNGSQWINHLNFLERLGGTSRTLTLRPQFDSLETIFAQPENIWSEKIAQWHLLDIPYGVSVRPDPALLEQEGRERGERITAEIARLQNRYGVTTPQEAIELYAADYNRITQKIDTMAAAVDLPRFVDNPPMSIDEDLPWSASTIEHGTLSAPIVESKFNGMESVTTGMAIDIGFIPEDQIYLLSLLPELMSDVGVHGNDVTLSYAEMQEALRHEIAALNVGFSINPETDRYELVIRGTGNNAAEGERAIIWMRRLLKNADWRIENLPRIRDMVEQNLMSLRTRMQGSEEQWVNDPAEAWRRQDNLRYLATSSFLTMTHNIHRLRWLLMPPPAGADERQAIKAFVEGLAQAGIKGSPAELATVAAALQDSTVALPAGPAGEIVEWGRGLPGRSQEIVKAMARDLGITLSDLPQSSLGQDWSYLCHQMLQDLMVPPGQTLANLDAIRRSFMQPGNIRFFAIGSPETLSGLRAGITTLLDTVVQPAAQHRTTNRPLIAGRLFDRGAIAQDVLPTHVALVTPNTSSGVFINFAPAAGYTNIDRESLLDYLSFELYSGGGSHGIFMKTFGAGLAYSNGLGISPRTHSMSYYAERCPALPQTMQFVINELRNATVDTTLVEYAVAGAFRGSRASSTYEQRGAAMAADIADGLTPERIQAFRQAILDLRDEPGLAQELYRRLPGVVGRVLQGWGPRTDQVPGAFSFVIGPEKQITMVDEYLKSAEPGVKVIRIYPRDFWMVAPMR